MMRIPTLPFRSLSQRKILTTTIARHTAISREMNCYTNAPRRTVSTTTEEGAYTVADLQSLLGVPAPLAGIL